MASGKWATMSRSFCCTRDRALRLTRDDQDFLVTVITNLWGTGLGFEEFTATTAEVLTAMPGLNRTSRIRLALDLWLVYQGQGAQKH